MEVYDTLREAVTAAASGDTRRIYRVTCDGDKCFVLASSSAQAALAVVGEENVSLVTQRERYDATRDALNEVIRRHNEKAEK